jgi:trk/ktr system potassium uptake protein
LARQNRPQSSGVVVIGLGRFGTSLAMELMGQGGEVLAIDQDAKVVQSLSGQLTHVVRADSTDEEAMRQLSVHELDHAVIGVGSNLESSILTASVLLSLGVGNIWAKAISHQHARILHQIGVHHVVRPEHDMGRRVAHLVRGTMMDYIEFEDGYAIAKSGAPECLHGISLEQSHPRSTYGVTIVGVKRSGTDFIHATSDTVVHRDDVLIVAGARSKVEQFCTLV